eukprot:8700214-Pyramimonas_sp.AAC.1
MQSDLLRGPSNHSVARTLTSDPAREHYHWRVHGTRGIFWSKQHQQSAHTFSGPMASGCAAHVILVLRRKPQLPCMIVHLRLLHFMTVCIRSSVAPEMEANGNALE